MNLKTKRPYIFIDGMNIFVRHYLVNETLNAKSEPIGGVVGFLKFVDYITRISTPAKVFVVWESGGGSARRRSIFKEYKKDRGKIKELKKSITELPPFETNLLTIKSAKSDNYH